MEASQCSTFLNMKFPPHLKQNIEAILVIMGLSLVLLDFVSVSNHTQINQWCYQIQRMGGPFAQKYFLMKGIFNSKRYDLKMQLFKKNKIDQIWLIKCICELYYL
jgi:hypothetical protein